MKFWKNLMPYMKTEDVLDNSISVIYWYDMDFQSRIRMKEG